MRFFIVTGRDRYWLLWGGYIFTTFMKNTWGKFCEKKAMHTLLWSNSSTLWLPTAHFPRIVAMEQIKPWAYLSTFPGSDVPSDSRSTVGKLGTRSIKSDESWKGKKHLLRRRTHWWEALLKKYCVKMATRQNVYLITICVRNYSLRSEQPGMIHKRLEATWT